MVFSFVTFDAVQHFYILLRVFDMCSVGELVLWGDRFQEGHRCACARSHTGSQTSRHLQAAQSLVQCKRCCVPVV
jgi:hypothetical protein